MITSRPKDAEAILTTNFEKSDVYNFLGEFFKDSLLTAKYEMWKVHRKMINPSFNPQILNSFHDIFVKYSKEVVKVLKNTNGAVVSDLILTMWRRDLDIVIETLADVDPTTIEDRYEHIDAVLRSENLAVQRFINFWLILDFFWKLSSLYKEFQMVVAKGRALTQNIITEAKKLDTTRHTDYSFRKKRFLANLFQINRESGRISQQQIFEETVFMNIAGSETSAVTVHNVLMFLGMFPHIQSKVYNEIISMLGSNDEDPSLEELNKLIYLERVIKETLRLTPVIPFVIRHLTSDVNADSCVYPAGCDAAISIISLHTDPRVWPNPKRFDPDRFLPEENEKRHRCSYIPFSFGSRNCIGSKFSMMSIKTRLSFILREFKIKTLDWKSYEDIEWEFIAVLKPKNCRMVLEKRSI